MENTKPAIAMIVAMDSNRAIGLNGDMPWRLSADLKRFRRITMGHPVIMGRRTFESLPGGALKGRQNIVITRNEIFRADDVLVARSPEEALEICQNASLVFVIGGGELYRHFLPLANLLYLTIIHNNYPADTWFPDYEPGLFEITAREEVTNDPGFPFTYTFLDLKRINDTDG